MFFDRWFIWIDGDHLLVEISALPVVRYFVLDVRPVNTHSHVRRGVTSSDLNDCKLLTHTHLANYITLQHVTIVKQLQLVDFLHRKNYVNWRHINIVSVWYYMNERTKRRQREDGIDLPNCHCISYDSLNGCHMCVRVHVALMESNVGKR